MQHHVIIVRPESFQQRIHNAKHVQETQSHLNPVHVYVHSAVLEPKQMHPKLNANHVILVITQMTTDHANHVKTELLLKDPDPLHVMSVHVVMKT